MASGGVGSRFLPLLLQMSVACIALRDFLIFKKRGRFFLVTVGRFFRGAFFGGVLFVDILGFTFLVVGGVGGYSCGKVVVERGKLVLRDWRPAGTTGR